MINDKTLSCIDCNIILLLLKHHIFPIDFVKIYIFDSEDDTSVPVLMK